MGLTAKSVEQAKPKVATAGQFKGQPVRTEIADSLKALRLVIQPNGAKSWALRFRSPIERNGQGLRVPKKLTLGPVALGQARGEPEIGRPLTLSQARMLATAALDQVRHNIDPTAARREQVAKAKIEASADNTVDAAMVQFLTRYRGKKKQGLRDSTRNLTATYFGLRPDPDNPGGWVKSGGGVLKSWSGRPLASITKRDAIQLIERIMDTGRGVTANRTLTNLKTFFTWCVKRDMLASSPVAMVDAQAPEASRERVLSDVELLALWRAADGEGYPFGKLLQLLLLTGARRDELRRAPRSEFNLASANVALPNGQTWTGPLWTLPAARAKNNREHLVPLTEFMLQQLANLPRIGNGKLLFTLTGTTPISGLSKAKKRLDQAMAKELALIDSNAKFEHWSPHDLRRTMYTGLQRLGFSIEIAEACVNHKSGTLRGVAAVYGRYQYLAEKTAAFEAWSRHVEQLVTGNPAERAVA